MEKLSGKLSRASSGWNRLLYTKNRKSCSSLAFNGWPKREKVAFGALKLNWVKSEGDFVVNVSLSWLAVRPADLESLCRCCARFSDNESAAPSVFFCHRRYQWKKRMEYSFSIGITIEFKGFKQSWSFSDEIAGHRRLSLLNILLKFLPKVIGRQQPISFYSLLTGKWTKLLEALAADFVKKSWALQVQGDTSLKS